MKVKFDNWETCHVGTAFVLEMECCPRAGEEILIHKSLFPESYYQDTYADNPMKEEYDGLILAKVLCVQHVLTPDGHMVKVDIDV